MLNLFDSHAHLDDQAFAEDRAELIAECEAKLAGVLNPGSDLQSSREAVSLAHAYEKIFAAVGFHPHEAKLMKENEFQQIAQLAQSPKVVAIGEIGLDYYYDHSPREVQKKVFLKQLDLAKQLNLPVIIHNRDAHGDIMEIIKKEGKNIRGVFHAYSGSWEMAKELLKLDWYLSFGGPLTFKNAVKNLEVAQNIPAEHMLIETDSPYLTPVPFRGKRNKPILVKLVCEKLAALRNKTPEEMAMQTYQNVKTLFPKID